MTSVLANSETLSLSNHSLKNKTICSTVISTGAVPMKKKNGHGDKIAQINFPVNLK